MKSRHFGQLVRFLAALLIGVNAHAQTVEPAAANSIENLSVAQQGGNTIIKVVLKQPLAAPPSSFSVANPARVVFDFASTANGLGRTVQQVNEGDLRSLNIVQVGDRTRLVLNLRKIGGFQGQAEGNAFVVTLAATAGEAAVAPAVQHFPATVVKTAEAPSVRDIKFRRGKAGEGLITVDLSDPSTGIDVKQQGQSLIVDFQGAQLPENLRRKLDVTDFATPVTTVNAMPQGKNTRLVITPQGLWEHTAYQSDNQFVVEVKPLKEDPSKIFQGSQRQGYQGEKVSLNFQNIPLRELLHVFADITNFNIVISDTVTGNVSLRLNDVPWDQALDIVLQQKGLSMRKNGNVIWIAPSDELAAREKLDLESKQVISDLEPVHTESFQLNYQKADVLLNVLLGGMPKGVSLPQGAKPSRLLSDRGSALMDARTNKLFVTDTPTKLAEIRHLLGEIDIPVRQVLIEARIVEAADTFSKSLGARIGVNDGKGLALGGHQLGNARWGVSATNSDANKILPYGPSRLMVDPNTGQTVTTPGWWVPTGRLTATPTVTTDPTTGLTTISSTFTSTAPTGSVPFNESQAVNLAATNPAGSFAFTLFNKSMTQLLGLEISAAETDGKSKTISSPRVLTADQVEATIEDGKEIPYWSATSSGATQVSYRKAVLSLKVRPQITPDGRVIMSVQVNKDSVDPSLSTSYGLAIDTKNVQTEVLVDNGGTVVIGGIYIQEDTNTVTKVPVLGDIPLLGYMFRKTDKAANRTELLVFLTPKIVSETLSMR
jgi:type IV pilus assembly protein PilQ